MAGYSGTPLAQKLGIRADSELVILGAPANFSIELPSNVVLRRRRGGSADLVVSFHTRAAPLRAAMAGLGEMVYPHGSLWVAWPKKASGVATDVTDHVVRDCALSLGLVDNKVCAIDETWTGLRLVWRTELRDGRRRAGGAP